MQDIRRHDDTKLPWHMDRVASHFALGRRVPPIHIDMGIAKFCNIACVFCLSANTKILMADFTWKNIQDVAIGDAVIGFDENRNPNTEHPHHAIYNPTIVRDVFKRRGRTHKIETADELYGSGTWLRITNEHQMLCAGHRWRSVKKIKTGDAIRFFSGPYKSNQKDNFLYKLGYLKGVTEGDGTICSATDTRPNQNGYEFRKFKIQMNDVDAIDRIEQYFKELFQIDLKRPSAIILRTDSKEEVNLIESALDFRGTKPINNWPVDLARGYLAGIFDAEGSLSEVVRIAQREHAPVMRHIEQALELMGFAYVHELQGYRLLGGYDTIARFLGQCRPAIKRKISKLYNRDIPKTVKIKKYRYGDGGITEDVYNIKTDSGTYVANGFCVHNCYGKFQNVKRVFIQRDALLQTVADASQIGVRSLAFIGDGEPTCNPHLYEALDAAAKTTLSMAISTNGILVNSDQRRDSILSACTWMRFCISAGTPEGYRQIHGRNWFNLAVDNISNMVAYKRAHGLPCEIGMQAVFVPTVMKDEMLREAELAVRLGVDYFVIKQCSLPDAGESGMSTFDLAEYDAPTTLEALRRCEELSNEKTQIIVKWNTIKQKGVRRYQGCPSVPFISEISGNGDWFPCGHMFGEKKQFEAYRFGNVHEKSLKEIFESARYWEIVSLMRNNFDVQRQCHGACRMDKTNEYCWDYLHLPREEFAHRHGTADTLPMPSGVNFI